MDERRWRIAFASLIALGIIDRVILLILFGSRHTGTDDVIIWEMARDYGQGIFHEPYMYGQNYNPILEALLGAPFIRLGLPPWIVFPIITSILALAPLWSFAVWHFRRGERVAALVFAAMPLLLPVEWGMLTTITRGFVHGIAMLAFLPWAMSAQDERRRHLLTALVIGAALFFNPNALVFLVPVAVVLLFQYARKPWFWIGSLLGILPAAWAAWAAHSFYRGYPYEMHHMIMDWELEFHPFLIGEAWGHLDSHFKALAPVLWTTGNALIGYLVLACVMLWLRRQRPHAIGIVASLLFMAFSLGFFKVHDGVDSIFYARSRMFLAAPLVLAWAVAQAVNERTRGSWVVPAMLVAAAGIVTFKAWVAPRVIAREMSHQEGALVREEKIADVKKRCEAIKAAAWEYGADVIVTLRWPDLKIDPVPHFQTYFDCYGCSHLVDGLPLTYGPGYERRAWVRDRVRDHVPHTPLFVGGDPTAWDAAEASSVDIEQVGSDPLLHVVQHNATAIDSIVVRWGLGQMR